MGLYWLIGFTPLTLVRDICKGMYVYFTHHELYLHSA